MKNTHRKRLSLKTETLRALADHELAPVAGGGQVTAAICGPTKVVSHRLGTSCCTV